MRLIEIAIALCIGAVVSAKNLTGLAVSLRKLNAQDEIPAIDVADVRFEEAATRHELDSREDVPPAGQLCTPSPLWAKNVDPARYEIGCKEVEVRGGALCTKFDVPRVMVFWERCWYPLTTHNGSHSIKNSIQGLGLWESCTKVAYESVFSNPTNHEEHITTETRAGLNNFEILSQKKNQMLAPVECAFMTYARTRANRRHDTVLRRATCSESLSSLRVR